LHDRDLHQRPAGAGRGRPDRDAGGQGKAGDIEQLQRISIANDGTTICGMGDAAGYATLGIIAKYRDEFEYFIEHKRSRFGGVLDIAAPAVTSKAVAHA
jgi:NADH-quinone oxidoreductase subunit F